LRIRWFRAFAHVRECFANQGRCDAETLSDERVEHGLERRDRSLLSRFNEHTECPSHGETARLCHVASDPFVDQQEISPKRLGQEDG
jgi:hypothetical protein